MPNLDSFRQKKVVLIMWCNNLSDYMQWGRHIDCLNIHTWNKAAPSSFQNRNSQQNQTGRAAEPLQTENVTSDFDTERFIYYLIQCIRFILNVKCLASQSGRKDIKFHPNIAHFLHDDVMFHPVFTGKG